SFHEELAENLTALEAGILTAAPVRGLRPTRAFRCVTENAPSSGHETLSPDRTPARSTSLNALSTRSASAFATPASLATLSRSSVLFKAAADSQVMKKYLTIRQEPWLLVMHFRDNARSTRASQLAHDAGNPFDCKGFRMSSCCPCGASLFRRARVVHARDATERVVHR